MKASTTYPPHVYPRPRRRKPNRLRLSPIAWAILLAGGGLLLLLLPVVLVLLVFASFDILGWILPGVTVGDASLAWMTREQAALQLDETWNRGRPVVLNDGVRAWQTSAGDLGLRLDPAATVEAAYQVGRGRDRWEELSGLFDAGSWPVTPVVQLDPGAARSHLETWAASANIPAQEASLTFAAGHWAAVPGRTGFALDVDATLAELEANPTLVLLTGYLHLTIQPVAPQVADLSGEVARLENMLNVPLVVRAYDPIADESLDWTVPREELASWVRVGGQPGELTFALDESRFLAYLESSGGNLGSGRTLAPVSGVENLNQLWQAGQPFPAQVRHQPAEYTVEKGDTLLKIAWKTGLPYWKILEGNPGLDPDRLVAGQTLVIPSKDEMLPLPVVMGKRIVISISKQRLWTYQDGERRDEHVISTGIDRSPTQPGVFQVRTHERNAYASVWDLHMPHFLGIYESWPGFMNGIHGLPTLSNGRRLWANVLGRPASYGCIILTLEAAEDLYRWAEDGVVVEIRP